MVLHSVEQTAFAPIGAQSAAVSHGSEHAPPTPWHSPSGPGVERLMQVNPAAQTPPSTEHVGRAA
jgi:hypothetical protein